MNVHAYSSPSFLQAPPDQDNTDPPVKNYVLYSDTEEDMREWINAISEEIKPVLGGKGLANGHPPTRLGRRKDEAKVDQKAFDEVCVRVCVLRVYIHAR